MSFRTARFALIASIAWPIAAQAQSTPALVAAEDHIIQSCQDNLLREKTLPDESGQGSF